MARNLLVDDEPVSRPRNLLADEVPVPSQEPEKPKKETQDRTFDVGKIPESTAYGTVFGAVAPEILKYGGKALQVPPQTRPLGLGMEVAGEALRGRRAASAFTGGLEAGSGEAATQLAKVLGAPEYLQTTAGLVAGVGTPTVLGALGRNIPVTREMLREAERGGFAEAGQRFAERIRGAMPSALREPQERVVARLTEEANRIRAGGQQQADRIMAEAQARAAQLAPGSEAQAQSILDDARNRAGAALFAARQQADRAIQQARQAQSRGRAAAQEAEAAVPQARQAIGQPAEVSDIGQSLRDKIVEVQKDRLAARTAQINADKDAVRAEVNAKQSQGQLVEDLPEFKQLLDEIKTKAGLDLNKPLQAERDPGTVSALMTLYNSLRKKQVEVDGTARDLPTSFDAIDTIRRKLGEAFRNPLAEGYGAIGQNMAKDYYVRLSEILGKYSDAKKKLISNYEELSRELDIFKTAAGRKGTAVDRYDPTRFQTDPASLPAEYFSSRQSVRDLIDLTGGDRGLVEQQARAYVARQLQTAQDANQVRNFVDRNSDWLREFPQLQSQVNQFAETLAGTARRTGRLGELEKTLKTQIKTLPVEAEKAGKKSAADIMKEAEAEAKRLRGPGAAIDQQARAQATQAQAQARREAAMLTQGMREDPVVFFDKLVESGYTPQFEAAARVIKSDPALMDDFVKGVQVSLSRVDPVMLPDKYTRLVEPALLRAGLISEQQAKQIADQVRLVGMTADPRALPIRTANLIKSAIVANLGMGGSRLMESLGLSFTQPFLGGGNAANQGLQ